MKLIFRYEEDLELQLLRKETQRKINVLDIETDGQNGSNSSKKEFSTKNNNSTKKFINCQPENLTCVTMKLQKSAEDKNTSIVQLTLNPFENSRESIKKESQRSYSLKTSSSYETESTNSNTNSLNRNETLLPSTSGYVSSNDSKCETKKSWTMCDVEKENFQESKFQGSKMSQQNVKAVRKDQDDKIPGKDKNKNEIKDATNSSLGQSVPITDSIKETNHNETRKTKQDTSHESLSQGIPNVANESNKNDAIAATKNENLTDDHDEEEDEDVKEMRAMRKETNDALASMEAEFEAGRSKLAAIRARIRRARAMASAED